MKHIALLWVVSLVYAFACSGDCLSCHPKLQDTIMTDERHKPMLTCIGCHKEESTGISECGKDCFACHSVERIDNSIKEHEVISKCRDCHTHLNDEDSLLSPVSPQESTSLKSLIFQ